MRLSRERSHLRGVPFRSPAFDLPSAKAGEASEYASVLSPATTTVAASKKWLWAKELRSTETYAFTFGISRKVGNAGNHEIKHHGFRVIARKKAQRR